MDVSDLGNRFKFHPATQDTGPRHDKVRALALEFAHKIDSSLEDCREKSLAITALEEVMMWTNAGIARGH